MVSPLMGRSLGDIRKSRDGSSKNKQVESFRVPKSDEVKGQIGAERFT